MSKELVFWGRLNICQVGSHKRMKYVQMTLGHGSFYSNLFWLTQVVLLEVFIARLGSVSLSQRLIRSHANGKIMSRATAQGYWEENLNGSE